MTEEIKFFIEQYQEMRSAQNRYGKSGDRASFVRAQQIQLKLDTDAPKLITQLNLPGVKLG